MSTKKIEGINSNISTKTGKLPKLSMEDTTATITPTKGNNQPRPTVKRRVSLQEREHTGKSTNKRIKMSKISTLPAQQKESNTIGNNNQLDNTNLYDTLLEECQMQLRKTTNLVYGHVRSPISISNSMRERFFTNDTDSCPSSPNSGITNLITDKFSSVSKCSSFPTSMVHAYKRNAEVFRLLYRRPNRMLTKKQYEYGMSNLSAINNSVLNEAYIDIQLGYCTIPDLLRRIDVPEELINENL